MKITLEHVTKKYKDKIAVNDINGELSNSRVLLAGKVILGIVCVFLVMLSPAFLSQMGCREDEHNLTEYFITIPSASIKQIVFSYIWGVVLLGLLSLPVMARVLIAHNYSGFSGYVAFSFFIPALACFLGGFTRSRRAFETVYLIFCFLLINMPSLLAEGYVISIMAAGTIVLMPAVLMKRAIGLSYGRLRSFFTQESV